MSQDTEWTGAEPPGVDSQTLDRLAAECGRSAAAVFALNGWKWTVGADGDLEVPDEARITKTVRHLLEGCPIDKSFSTGRLHAYRYIEDGREHYCVSLDLGDVSGEELPPSPAQFPTGPAAVQAAREGHGAS